MVIRRGDAIGIAWILSGWKWIALDQHARCVDNKYVTITSQLPIVGRYRDLEDEFHVFCYTAGTQPQWSIQGSLGFVLEQALAETII